VTQTGESIQCPPEGGWEAHYDKAVMFEKLGFDEEATGILDGLIEEYLEDPKFLVERGSYANEMGYPQEALQYYQRAMEFWINDPSTYMGIPIYAGLCHAYNELGEKRKAMEVALEGLKKFPNEDPILYQNVAATYYEMGWKDDAREILKEGIEKFPEDEDLKQCLKDLNDDLDDPEGGIIATILGLIVLTALSSKRMRGRRRH